MLTEQSYLFGEAPPDLGIAAIGIKLDENGALDLQYRKKLIEKTGDHSVPDRSRKTDGRACEPRANCLRNRRKLVEPPGHLALALIMAHIAPFWLAAARSVRITVSGGTRQPRPACAASCR